MTIKYLQRKIKIESEELENPGPVELEYYLLERNEKHSPGLGARKVYGICITRKVSDSCFEEKSVVEVYCSAEKTVKLIRQLADNTVTPASLLYILDDIICS